MAWASPARIRSFRFSRYSAEARNRSAQTWSSRTWILLLATGGLHLHRVQFHARMVGAVHRNRPWSLPEPVPKLDRDRAVLGADEPHVLDPMRHGYFLGSIFGTAEVAGATGSAAGFSSVATFAWSVLTSFWKLSAISSTAAAWYSAWALPLRSCTTWSWVLSSSASHGGGAPGAIGEVWAIESPATSTSMNAPPRTPQITYSRPVERIAVSLAPKRHPSECIQGEHHCHQHPGVPRS